MAMLTIYSKNLGARAEIWESRTHGLPLKSNPVCYENLMSLL